MKKDISEHLRIIAEQEGITETQVRDGIALAISLALKSSNPDLKNFWKAIPCEGESPTVEEMIDYIAAEISEHPE